MAGIADDRYDRSASCWRRRAARALVLAGVALMAGLGCAQAEGILNAACTPGDKFIVTDHRDSPADKLGRGHGMAAFVRARDGGAGESDYMMLVWAPDSGRGDGGISFYDWNRPEIWSAPTRQGRVLANELREAHSTPTTDMFGGAWRSFVLQATNGFSVYDVADIAAPRRKANYAIAGSSKGGRGSNALCGGRCATSYDAAAKDYGFGAVWFLGLAAPYLYVAQTDNGLNIYKFTDPDDPSKITWVKRLDTSWFGHRVNQAWVMGDLLVVAAVQMNYGVTLLDIGNPENPVKKARYDLRTNPKVREVYSWTLNGTRLYGAGKNKTGLNSNGLEIFDLNQSNSSLSWVGEVKGTCSAGAYASIQDKHAHVGFSSCYSKIDLNTMKQVSPTSRPWSIGIGGTDNDFPTLFGNNVFIGNDHHTTPGSAVLCHQAAKDTASPVVNGRAPRDQAKGVKVTSGIGLSFSDNLKPWTINEATVAVRRKDTRQVVKGYYSYQLNIVNFRPATPLAARTTYEVQVTSGVRDLAGNSAAPSSATFTTE